MYFSTRNQKLRIPFSQAILQGLSLDGGLFLPERIFSFTVEKTTLSLSYPELAYQILRPYFDDFTDEEVRDCLSKAYDRNHFEEKIMDVTSLKDHSIMELFHGQTLTFKDMALSLLPYLMVTARKKHPEEKKIRILTATSGDTGSAVLSSFYHVKDIDVSILYPEGGVSPLQEKQMLYFTSSHSRAYALKDSNFDDCQSFVKSMLVKYTKEGYTSANSINIGRLLPQIVYYYFSYITLVNRGVINLEEKIDVVVPTGNFGDIFAGYLAKKMGLPIHRLVIASNENRILTDFFTTGIYDLHRPFMKTNSPSMDILISSNLERLLYFLYGDDKEVSSLMDDLKEKKMFSISKEKLQKLQSVFSAYSCDEKETENTIRECYLENHYLLDPHSAVAYQCYQQYRSNTMNHILIVSTASPLKFASTILESLSLPKEEDEVKNLYQVIEKTKTPLPSALKKVLDSRVPRYEITKEHAEKKIFSSHGYLIRVGATSANVGPGFDVLGLALKIHNVYFFKESEKDQLVDFGPYSTPDNMVLTSYQYAFRKLDMEPVKVTITQLEENIPPERGLGSSSSCILAGLLGADEILKHRFTKEEIYQMAVTLEGHPDNVGCCLFGGLIVNRKDDRGEYHHYSLPVSKDLLFCVVSPQEKVLTAKAREVLPSFYSREDVVSNLSCMALLPLAFEKGDLNLLSSCMEDRIHVPYRSRLITDFDIFKKIAISLHLPFTISGSGSSMIYFLKEANRESLIRSLEEAKKNHSFVYHITSLEEEGCQVEEKENE